MFDGSFFQIASNDAVYRGTLITAAVILFVTGLVAVVATVLHVQSHRRSRRHAKLEDSWRPMIEAALAGHYTPDAVRAHVSPRHRRQFLRFLLRSSRNRAPHEVDALKQLASPYLEAVRTGSRFEAPEGRAGRLLLLGWLGGPEDLPQLVAALDDRSSLAALVALRALVRRRELHTIDQIVANLDRFRFWNMRTIASLLAEMGPAIAPSLRDRVIDRTVDLRVRLIGLTTLQELGGVTATRTAIELIERSDERALVTGSLRILEASGDMRHLPLLREMTTSSDEVVRLRAFAALSSIDLTSEAATLEFALEDRSPWVALRAAQALLKAGQIEVLERTAAGSSDRAELAKQVLAQRRRATG